LLKSFCSSFFFPSRRGATAAAKASFLFCTIFSSWAQEGSAHFFLSTGGPGTSPCCASCLQKEFLLLSLFLFDVHAPRTPDQAVFFSRDVGSFISFSHAGRHDRCAVFPFFGGGLVEVLKQSFCRPWSRRTQTLRLL